MWQEGRRPFVAVQTLIGNEQRKFLAAQEQIRQEQERKARMAADEAARKERAKLEAQAAKAAEKGKGEKAADLIEKAQEVVAAPVFVAPVVDKNVRKDISVTVTDLKALCAAIGSGQVPTTVIDVKAGQLKPGPKQCRSRTVRLRALLSPKH